MRMTDSCARSFLPGDSVRLLEAPDGCTTRHDPLTVGRTYTVLELAGSCLRITTDEPEASAFIWRGRFELAQP